MPGPEGSFVFIRDAHYKKPDRSLLPFPTFFIPEGEEMEKLEPIIADLGDNDPFITGD